MSILPRHWALVNSWPATVAAYRGRDVAANTDAFDLRHYTVAMTYRTDAGGGVVAITKDALIAWETEKAEAP